MIQNKTHIIFISILVMNLNYGLAKTTINHELLVKSCDHELGSSNFNGSCLLLGLHALKTKRIIVFEKIDKICTHEISRLNASSLSSLEPLLSYFPKCYYIYKDKIRDKKQNGFNGPSELKDLVRFLNSN